MKYSKLLIVITLVVIILITLVTMTLYPGPPRKEESHRLEPPGLPDILEWVTALPRQINVKVLAPNGTPLPIGAKAPRDYTCDGQGVKPLIKWNTIKGAKAYTVIVYDPDAPSPPFYHLIAYNIRGASLDNSMEFLPNTAGQPGWYPICPPPGHGKHRYIVVVIAQDTTINRQNTLKELVENLEKHAIAYGWHMLVYSR